MRFTVSMPHNLHGNKIEGRISKDYLTLNFLLPEEAYVNHNGFNYLGEKGSVLKERIFNSKLNRTRFLVKQSDTNKTLPVPITNNEQEYEPAMCKIWLPNSEILGHTLDAIINSAYIEGIYIDSCSLSKKSPTYSSAENIISRYNATIGSEKERREFYQNYVKRSEEYESLIPEKLKQIL